MISEKSQSKLALHKKMTELCGFNDSQCKVYPDIFKQNNRELGSVGSVGSEDTNTQIQNQLLFSLESQEARRSLAEKMAH